MPAQAEEPLMGSCASTERESFTSLEWLVIAIGARDESVPLQWSPFGRPLLALMGGGPRPLASQCLETLRRTASIARHYGWAMPSADVGAFLLSGWSEAQLELVIESVGPNGPSMDPWQPVIETNSNTTALPPSNVRTPMDIYA